jgi:hypothetical protein
MVIWASLTGCYTARWSDYPQAKTALARAAHEFPCPEAHVDVVEHYEGTFVLSGCGRQATYTCLQQSMLVSSTGYTCMREGAVEAR